MTDLPDPDAVAISLAGVDPLSVLGQRDRNLRAIEAHFDVSAVVRNGELRLFGDPRAVDAAAALLSHLVTRVRSGRSVAETDVTDYLDGRLQVPGGSAVGPDIVIPLDRKRIKPRTDTQVQYLEAIGRSDIVFGIGPAGTGKTYLAVAMAMNALKAREVDRLVLVRPAVEAGEKLGYLPGDLQQKVDPYLRPLYDALEDMISYDKLQKYLQTGVIEIAPLAFMRGRTLARAFVIMDEAQNSTLAQMKMFLTRLGVGSRSVVTGDVTQIDLQDPEESGLIKIQPILADVEGVDFIHFAETDVVRHRLVRDILEAFDRTSDAGASPDGPAPGGSTP